MAIFFTLFSWRGIRLLELYQSKSAGVSVEDKEQNTKEIVQEWMETFPDDQEKWVDLIVRALWLADPGRDLYPDDSEDYDFEDDEDDDGGEDGSDGRRETSSDHDGDEALQERGDCL